MDNSKEKEVFSKISELKEIITEKIKSFEDYKLSKTTLLSLIEKIESILNQIFPKKEETKENNEESLKEKADSKQEINNNQNNEEINKENEKEKEENDSKLNEEENDENNNQEEEESEKHSLPKLNFDYDKNINEILSNINPEQNRPFLKTNSENDINNYLNKENEIENKHQEILKEENIKITNNGYSNLFSFNQDLSNMNTTEDFTSKKNKIKNSNTKENELINNHNNINNISIQNEENIMQQENKENENNNIKNTKAMRVADIIMKINSNDILYDIITQLYSKEILDQLMSPNVDINLINIIEQTIDKITVLENEEIQKLQKKETSLEKDINIKETKQKDKYIYNDLNKRNINNYNKLNIPKRSNEYKKYKSSSSFYDKNKNNSISSISSIYNNSQKIPKNKKVSSHKKNRTKVEMHLNSEILQNYPKTGKTILGYEKFKRERNKDFNFERSLRNDNYEDNYLNKRNYNLNMSKADSIKNISYYSINNNRSSSNKKMIFNNYTSPFGDYFDSSLQKGGESKLYYPKKNRPIFKDARSPVKDYIDGLNDVYI